MLMILMAIDDEPALLGLIRAVFLDEGWEVEAVGNGVDALRLLDAGATPDAIVLDLAMPELDGRTIFREIRRRGIAAPVLVLSAFGARDARRELGAEGYLEKPFDVDILIGGCRRSFAGLKQASPLPLPEHRGIDARSSPAARDGGRRDRR